MSNYLTADGLEKLKKELDFLKTTKRKEIRANLKHAISFGDLRENAAYQEAKEAQEFLENRILELEKIISDAKIIEKKQKSDKIQIGSMVLVFDGKEKQLFQIVGSEEANPLENKISYLSPLGKHLINKNIGDQIEINVSENKIKYEILEIK